MNEKYIKAKEEWLNNKDLSASQIAKILKSTILLERKQNKLLNFIQNN